MKNIFRSILLSAVALTAGFAVSCTDPAPENGHYEGTPTISVSPASVTVPLAGGTTEAITVTTPAEWTLTIDAEDVVASTTAGNGDGVVTFEVPAVEAMRTIKVTFTATGYVSGFPITKKASVSISQTDTEVPSVDGPFVYYDNCGEAVSNVEDKWPYVDAYAGWNPTGGEGFDQSGVTYTGKNASVRNSGKSWAPVGATYATDAPYAYLQAKDGVEFIIHNINIKSGVKNYTFSFTAHNQYANMTASPYTPAPVSPLKSGENLTVEVSVDGQNWGAIAFTTMADGNWEYAIAPFTLPADADKLFVRFSGYKADTTTALPSSEYQYQAALRFDDFRLVEGGEGPVVDFNNAGAGGGEVVEGTIESILAGGEGSYSLKNAWVVATYGRGCLITDASGKYILCYMGSDKTIPAVGAVVEVNGAVTTYAGLLQFGDTAVVTATGETKSVDHGTAATMTGADLDAYVSAPAVKYASFEGALAISGNYYNVTVEGATTAIGSLSYPAGEIATQLSSLNGKGIKVTGYLIGVSSGKYTNMMVTAVSATGDDPEVPEAKTATMIDKIASLTAGNYFMAAFLESYDTYNWAANPYHCWTGKTSTSNGKTDLETISYSYTDGVLAPGSGVFAYPAVVTLEAVDGKANTYYIKVGDNYLANASAANRQLALGTTKAEWVAADQAKGGITFTNNGATFGTANASKTHIRSYTDATSLAYGVVFFTTDGAVAPTPTPDPEPEPDPTPGEAKTIAEILAAGNGAALSGTIEGVVVSNMDLNNLTSKKGLYVQDETGALQFYLAANHEFAFGTKVQIDLTGTTLGQYNGAVQVSGLALEKITTVSTGNTVEPKVVTIADFLANKYEGQYVAIEGVQVASADLTKTWVTGGAHTSINMEDAAGNKFVVFSSKYASYGAETVAQGSGTIKGISSISKGVMQIIFAQASDYASLTGERFDTGATPEPEPEPTPDPTPGEGTTVTATFNQMGFTNAQTVDGVEIKVDDNVTIKFSKANSGTAPAYYDASNGIRMYQNGATLDVTANGKTITNIEFVFDYSQWYLGADSGTLSAEGDTRTWTGSATAVKFTSTGTDKDHRAYIKAMTITYK
ncbi:MAG: BACON domain-containing protein [Alistipes sp.]|nr:BACON domain-containing protein [Alistipes sp.]